MDRVRAHRAAETAGTPVAGSVCKMGVTSSVVVCALLIALVVAIQAKSVALNTGASADSGNHSYEGQEIVVASEDGMLTGDGTDFFKNIEFNGGTTLRVPGAYPRIQKAIDAAVDGDVVMIADGLYQGTGNIDLDFRGKAITVQSENGPSGCIIDCEHKGRGFTLHSGETTGSVVKGLTIRNGMADKGGGIYCQNASVRIIDCVIADNSSGDGGAIWCRYGLLDIDNSIIRDNYCFYRGSGGGMNVWDSSPTMKNSFVVGNSAPFNQGGGIQLHTSSCDISHSIIARNSSETGGGGLFLEYTKAYQLSNCTIAGNKSPNERGAAIGIYSEGACPHYADYEGGDYHLKSQAGRWDPNSQIWVRDDVTSPCIDAGDPNGPVGDELEPNGGVVNMGAYGGTVEASMSLPGVYMQWLGHASVKIWTEDAVVYVDPRDMNESPHDATLVLVTHPHGDHYQPDDIANVSGPGTIFVAPPDVVHQYGRGEPIAPGQTIAFAGVPVTAVAAYNRAQSYHPRSRNWVGFVIELGARRIYVAGDTDLTDEMEALDEIDVAILPVGGTYTMDAVEAAEATRYLQPDLAVPYRWGDLIGGRADAHMFAGLARCAVKILAVGETISSANWPTYLAPIAHWELDEEAGEIAGDSVGIYEGILNGIPTRKPASGIMRGALEFDGIDDYVRTSFLLNPSDGPFGAFAWIKGDTFG